MRAIATAEMRPPSGVTEGLWIYNGLDCCVTLEVLEAIRPQLDNVTGSTYAFSRALQAPVLEMSMRGVLIDQHERFKLIDHYQKQLTQLEGQLNRILSEGVGVDLNWRSPIQLKDLFYHVMQIPEVRKQGKVTVDRDALEKLDNYFYAGPIVKHLLTMRDISKKIGVLKTSVDSDGRMRTSYNIAGTTTGRFSSSFSTEGTGTNFQNIEEKLRRIFIADPNFKFAYIDLEQAESRLVGALIWNLFKDGRYLDACESGDLHTAVCRLAWTNLDWTGDLVADRKVAESPFYRQHSYRHMAKVLGHGTNYNGQPYTMAKHTKLAADLIKEFQSKYFDAFPGIRGWHTSVEAEVRSRGCLTSLTGRKRWFFGRRNDAETVRQAIAFDPQGSVGDILNTGMLQVWRLNICQLMMQVHDAILVQYPEDQEDKIIPQILQAIQVPVELKHGRQLLIPSEAKTGWNWSNEGEGNVDGLRKYSRDDSRRRTTHPTTSLMDRLVL